MASSSQISSSVAELYAGEDERWRAVVSRDTNADGVFYFSVRTTGVYCRPGCPARTPQRKNVRFHATREEAEAAGFRPCKRCRPNEASREERHAAIAAQACRRIDEAEAAPSLQTLADAAGMSVYHFHRLFKAQTGVTPKAYARAARTRRVQNALARGESVTEAVYRAGFSSNSRFYESSTSALGMTPKTFRAAGAVIRFALGECWLGSILVAATDQGVCAILLGDDPDLLTRDLQDRFPQARLLGGDAGFEQWMATVVGFVNEPATGFHLPLDLRGTAFQCRVWEALRVIPPGSTATYTEIAERLGSPRSVRAVARACAANPVAVAIPCHRVVRRDGSLSGYRWGVERKKRLLQHERETS